MDLLENEILLTDDEGNEFIRKILFTYHNPERNTDYVFFYDEANPDDVFVMKYNEEHELLYIEDDEEMEEASEVLNAYDFDPAFDEIK